METDNINEENIDDEEYSGDIDADEESYLDEDDVDITEDDIDSEGEAESVEAAAQNVTQEPDYEAMRKQAYEEGLRQGRVKAFEGKTNHFTDEPISDEVDLHAYEVMLAIEKDGGDPIADYHKYDIKQKRERFALENRQSSEIVNRQKDIEDFTAVHKDISILGVFADESFKRFASGKLGNQNLSQIYEDYLSYNAEVDRRIAQRSKLNVAKQKATPGALSTGKATPSKGVDDLSAAEFEAFKQRALRGEIRR